MSEWGWVLFGCTLIGIFSGETVATAFFGIGTFVEYLRYNGDLK